MHHLDRVGAEPRLALPGPPVGRIGRIPAERRHRRGVGPDRRPPQPLHPAQLAQPLIQHLRPPLPRHGVGVRGERPHHRLPPPGRGQRQVPGQLLRPPPLQHRREHLLIRMQQRHARRQVQARRPRRPVPPHPITATLRHLHQTKESFTRCRRSATRQAAARRNAGHPPGAICKMRRTKHHPASFSAPQRHYS